MEFKNFLIKYRKKHLINFFIEKQTKEKTGKRKFVRKKQGQMVKKHKIK